MLEPISAGPIVVQPSFWIRDAPGQQPFNGSLVERSIQEEASVVCYLSITLSNIRRQSLVVYIELCQAYSQTEPSDVGKKFSEDGDIEMIANF
jgi:hypothetical protein